MRALLPTSNGNCRRGVIGLGFEGPRAEARGGIFGVVRAFGAATETQLAGDLHVHIALWLHGFPAT
jgi:hypothetical protein